MNLVEKKSATEQDVSGKSKRVVPTFTSGQYEINYIAVAVLCLPIMGVVGATVMGVELQLKTFCVAVAFYIFNGLVGITMGYHRLFSHRAFEASPLVQWVCAFAGAGAFEGSAKWWGRNHRIHHRYVDTNKDPYNATRGFFYSHMGWMIMKQDYSLLGKVDVSDYRYNRVIQLQHKYFFRMAMLSGVILPTMICGLGWGDWMGGYFYAALAKIVFVHHCTFFINSLAHTSWFFAKRSYTDRITAHDSIICALLTFGEGYHNFHHEFAQDYRNGVKWYHFDPTKWTIWLCSVLGLVSNLVRTPNDIIIINMNKIIAKESRRRLEDAERMIKARESPILETWTWESVREKVAQGRKLVVVRGMVIDLLRPIPTGPGYTHKSSDMVWYTAHPGGQRMLDLYMGKDATEAYEGKVYNHSLGADSYLTQLCVGRIQQGDKE